MFDFPKGIGMDCLSDEEFDGISVNFLKKRSLLVVKFPRCLRLEPWVCRNV